MMYRKAYLESRRVLADSGEVTVDVTVRDPVTALWVEVRATNGSTNNQANTVAQNVSAIEVIDGSNVLYSMSGEEAVAWSAYYAGRMPLQLIDENPSTVQDLSICIPWGRFLGDTTYALDPSRFTNLQVRVKWNLASVTAMGATGFESGTGQLTVVAEVMEGAPTPVAYLMAKEHYTSAGASSGVDYVDLPRDHSYAWLLLRAYKAATAINGVISQVKLNADASKVIPFDLRMTDLLRDMGRGRGRFTYRHSFHETNGDTLYTLLKFSETVGLVPCDVNDCVAGYNHVGYGSGGLRLYTAGVAETVDRRILAQVGGWCPYGVVGIPFGDGFTPGDFFPVDAFGSVRLELTQAAAPATIAVCLVQARSY